MSKVIQLRKELSKISTGYGLMSLTWKEPPVPMDQAFKTMHQVIKLAQARNHKAFFNVGEFYGPDYRNLTYCKEFFAKYPDLRKDVIISCKGAYDGINFVCQGKHDQVIDSVKACVQNIGGYIDIFEPARLDMEICSKDEVYPRETFEALAELIEEGVIGAMSLSEVVAKEITAVHKDFAKYLACVEVELSMFTTDILHNDVAKVCSEYGLIIICYSPLGRGLLTGQIKTNNDIPEGSYQKAISWFHGDRLKQNLVLVQFLENEIRLKRDAAHAVSLTQIALGWIKHFNSRKEFSGARFIPIPSGSTLDKIEQNFDEDKCKITDEEFTKIEDFLKNFETQGGRYEFVHE
ncbi:pyridoxine 4-dehydrogenase NDAI_0A04610 [Naumovozyma dairenensis CBS 421]|uniref:NADP-dependent oxidoreductase domain-containing protein n=1 Tax=Naumovozyma dairenensis (strain ATCC 10597 / BCRC 20456 / CBS 421 / NBRC 0211 / NRRL Y-12639) TaxID=1071378 RepID=G0W479_NAUDC|nr:hypothetical protein NDAI_0A04610 [Naumovozyma dairenensis CBS 421]CCD22617.1 hypothetical protein NDAI_0A04610 [Naumovozyma dairenensis CBS 421]